MRLGIVRGHVVLHTAVPELRGTRLLIVEPVTAANLAAGNGQGGGKALSWPTTSTPALGQMVGLRRGPRGREPLLAGEGPGRRVLLAARRRDRLPAARTGWAAAGRPRGQTMKSVDLSGQRSSRRRTSRPRCATAPRRWCSRPRAVVTPVRARRAAPARLRPCAGDGKPAAAAAAPRPRAASRRPRAPLRLAGGRGGQGRDRRRRPQALAAAVRRRQRRQHLLPPRRERGPLHADARQQGRPAPRGPVPGRPRGQPARRDARRGRARS